ncbi:cupin domain-containing protein [Asanoa hainanensis]|uniref:cupin domain-containing protein n=1 Tax=Asanoa hainanensis TaxID=560556 RepID=UPI001C52CC54
MIVRPERTGPGASDGTAVGEDGLAVDPPAGAGRLVTLPGAGYDAARTVLVAGHVRMNQVGDDLLLAALPPLSVIPGGAPAIGWLLDRVVGELTTGRPGSPTSGWHPPCGRCTPTRAAPGISTTWPGRRRCRGPRSRPASPPWPVCHR